jgi:hypothetical protein
MPEESEEKNEKKKRNEMNKWNGFLGKRSNTQDTAAWGLYFDDP